MNLSVLVVVQFWAYLAAAVFGPVARSDDNADLKNVIDVVRRWKNLMGSSWWKTPANENDKTAAAVLPSTVASPNTADGFFNATDRRRPTYKKTSAIGRRRVTSRPKDEKKNATVGDGLPTATATAAVGSNVAGAFDNETECVSANNGRPCVCRMAEFLNSIGKRLDETAADDQTPVATAFRCPSYKPVPASFAVFPTAGTSTDGTTATAVDVLGRNDTDNTAADVPVPRKVDFNYVVNYELETSKDDHYAVHYGMVGSDMQLRCLIDRDGNNTEIKTYKWNYTKPKNKTNLIFTGTNMSNLFILELTPRDSTNYTCSPKVDEVRNSTGDKPYKHYVIAVENPIYEIHGTAFYKTVNSGDCTPEVIGHVRKDLPDYIRSEMCPEEEGSSRYACNVAVETAKCLEEEAGVTLEVKYLVTSNEKAGYLTRIKANKKGRDALYRQQLLARISNVLAENLNKALMVQITSQMSPNHTRFDPDYDRTKINKYVSCSPGFGVREVFCAACPPNHYSPDKRADCLKCPKGFHQLNAGSKTCVKCPNINSSGCYMSGVPYIVYYVSGFVFSFVSLIVVMSCWCCCRDENEADIKILPRQLRKKLNRRKRYDLTANDKPPSMSTVRGKYEKPIEISRKSKNSVTRIKFKDDDINRDIQIP